MLLFKNVKKCIRTRVKYPSCFLMGQLSFQDEYCFTLMVWTLTVFIPAFLSFAFNIVRQHACWLMQIIFLVSVTNKNRFVRLVFVCFADAARECESIREEYMMLEKNVHSCRQYIHNTKATLQRALMSWATFEEDLALLKASFDLTKKEQIKEVFEVNGAIPVLHFIFGD